MNTLDLIKSELSTFSLELSSKPNGREGVDFLVENNQLYLQSVDLDTTQRSIKISNQDLGELKERLFFVLVLIIYKDPKVNYLIPYKKLSKYDIKIFINK